MVYVDYTPCASVSNRETLAVPHAEVKSECEGSRPISIYRVDILKVYYTTTLTLVPGVKTMEIRRIKRHIFHSVYSDTVKVSSMWY